MQPTQQPYPEQSQATLILVLGIVSLVCIQPLGIAAWIMGNTELKAIDEGRRPPENRGTANAGKICGIIAVAIFALVVLAFVVLVAVAGVGFFDSWDMSDFGAGA